MWYFLFYVCFGVWVFLDGGKRNMNAIPWAIGTALIGPVVLPVYLAKRPLKEGEIREGGTAWNILRNFALFWTILMAVATVWGLIGIGSMMSGYHNEYEKAGAAIGTAIGLGLIGAIWFFPMVGALALGFMLKKSSIIEKGPTIGVSTVSGSSSTGVQPFCTECGAKVKSNTAFCNECGAKIKAR